MFEMRQKLIGCNALNVNIEGVEGGGDGGHTKI